jgi:hypothetical protein
MDSLLYSNCDVNEDGDEGDVNRERIKPTIHRDRSFFQSEGLGSDNSFERELN